MSMWNRVGCGCFHRQLYYWSIRFAESTEVGKLLVAWFISADPGVFSAPFHISVHGIFFAVKQFISMSEMGCGLGYMYVFVFSRLDTSYLLYSECISVIFSSYLLSDIYFPVISVILSNYICYIFQISVIFRMYIRSCLIKKWFRFSMYSKVYVSLR